MPQPHQVGKHRGGAERSQEAPSISPHSVPQHWAKGWVAWGCSVSPPSPWEERPALLPAWEPQGVQIQFCRHYWSNRNHLWAYGSIFRERGSHGCLPAKFLVFMEYLHVVHLKCLFVLVLLLLAVKEWRSPAWRGLRISCPQPPRGKLHKDGFSCLNPLRPPLRLTWNGLLKIEPLISERSWKNWSLEPSGPRNKAAQHQSPEAEGPVAISYRSRIGMGLPRRRPHPTTTVCGPPGQGFTGWEQLSHTSTALAFLHEVVYIQSSVSKKSLFPPHNPALCLNINTESSMHPPTFKTSSAEPAVRCSSEEEPRQRLHISKQRQLSKPGDTKGLMPPSEPALASNSTSQPPTPGSTALPAPVPDTKALQLTYVLGKMNNAALM